MKKDISGSQIRAGRALVDWSREDLAAHCSVTVRSLARIEAGETVPRKTTVLGIRNALEAAGIEFIAENGGGAGVRLRKVGQIKELTKGA